MNSPENPNGHVKALKNRALLHVDDETTFEKIIAPDAKTVIFKKMESVRPNILETANELFDDHADLMKRLECL